MKKKTKGIKNKLVVAGIVVAMIILLVIFVPRWLFPPYEPPTGTGKYKVAMETFTWEDKNRKETFSDTVENRALTVRFLYPEEKGNYPLVVFSHGACGVIDSNYSTCLELASKGYVVASVAHPYHAMFVEDVDGKTTYIDVDFMKRIYAYNSTEKKVYEFSLEWMELRTADINFVLDTILQKAQEDEGFFSFIDVEKIGLFGHSMGGATVVQVGRDRDDIDAVIDLEGMMAGEYVGFDDEKGYEIYNETPYPVPLLDINSKAVRDQIAKQEDEIPGWEYVNDYVGKNALNYKTVIFYGAGHLNFTDLPMVSPVLAKLLGVGEVDAKECITNVNGAIGTFFDYYLKKEGTIDDIKNEY